MKSPRGDNISPRGNYRAGPGTSSSSQPSAPPLYPPTRGPGGYSRNYRDSQWLDEYPQSTRGRLPYDSDIYPHSRSQEGSRSPSPAYRRGHSQTTSEHSQSPSDAYKPPPPVTASPATSHQPRRTPSPGEIIDSDDDEQQGIVVEPPLKRSRSHYPTPHSPPLPRRHLSGGSPPPSSVRGVAAGRYTIPTLPGHSLRRGPSSPPPLPPSTQIPLIMTRTMRKKSEEDNAPIAKRLRR